MRSPCAIQFPSGATLYDVNMRRLNYSGPMTPELNMLALSVVLGLVPIVLASHTASLQRGYLWTASFRDEAAPPLTGVSHVAGMHPQ